MQKVMRSLRPDITSIRCTNYERLFRDMRAPLGHYIFSDLDMLSHYEREVVISIADALRRADAGVRILNDPRMLLERYPLLRTLEREGINRFSVTRLDGGDRPARYPVFIRCEDNHLGVDTQLLNCEQEFEAALAELQRQGKVLKRRIAIEFCAQRSEDGQYRKYGVVNIGGELIPQHVLHSDHWLVKRLSRKKTMADFEEDAVYVKENPHREQIGRIFALAHIDYGRVDYALVDGQIQVYEINTNPNLPPLVLKRGDDNASRRERRSITRDRFINAFTHLDTSLSKQRHVHFELPMPGLYLRPWRPWQRRVLMNFQSRHPSAKRFIPRRYW